MIQIKEALFYMLYNYFVHGNHQFEDRIRNGIEEKNDNILKRYIYTQSKTAKTDEEKEAARQEYLDLIGVPEDYRY